MGRSISARRRSRPSRPRASCRMPGATASAAWSPRARTGASAASAAGACRSPSSSIAAPASRCATPTVMERVVAAFREEGADAWYSSPPSRFLGNDRDPEHYEQVTDIVDVWFESGSTHAFVLEGRGLPWPADLYLEGSDQHRGWFHTCLLEAVGTRGRAPFEAVLTHGFVLDEQGRKMSKSLGNVVAPEEVTKQYGADILRLWVMSSRHQRGSPHRQGDPQAAGRTLSPPAQHAALAARQPRRVQRERARERRRDARAGALGAAPPVRARRDAARGGRELRLDGRLSRHPQFLRVRPLGLLFRHPQGRALLRPARQPAPPRRAHRARHAASLPLHLARAGAVLHRRGGLVRALRRGRQRASRAVPGDPGGMARRGARRRNGQQHPRGAPLGHRQSREDAAGRADRRLAAGRRHAALAPSTRGCCPMRRPGRR